MEDYFSNSEYGGRRSLLYNQVMFGGTMSVIEETEIDYSENGESHKLTKHVFALDDPSSADLLPSLLLPFDNDRLDIGDEGIHFKPAETEYKKSASGAFITTSVPF